MPRNFEGAGTLKNPFGGNVSSLVHERAFRSAATAALEGAGIGWSAAHYGVTVRTSAAVPPGLAALGPDAGLPDLPPLYISLYGPADDAGAPVVGRLRALLQESLETCLAAAM